MADSRHLSRETNVRALPMRGEVEVYLNRRQVAERLGIGLTKLDELVKEGCPSHTWGLRVRRFRFSEVEQWLQRRERIAA